MATEKEPRKPYGNFVSIESNQNKSIGRFFNSFLNLDKFYFFR